MNASDSDEEFYNERTALVPSEKPVVSSYQPDPDVSASDEAPTNRVKVTSLFCIRLGQDA